jgi:hypothetical protein
MFYKVGFVVKQYASIDGTNIFSVETRKVNISYSVFNEYSFAQF